MAAVPEELSGFVKEALSRRLPRADIEAAAIRAGWPADRARAALAAFAETDFPIPVPRPAPRLDARDAFLYLVLFSTLYISAYHLGGLLFDLVNRALPDAADLSRSTDWRQSIRWSIASLVVALPVFLYTSHRVERDIAADPGRGQSSVRRWLIYLTLFVAASVLLGDLITLIYNLLGGELTLRFVLKALIVGSIAGAVFWYYRSEIGRGV